MVGCLLLTFGEPVFEMDANKYDLHQIFGESSFWVLAKF